MRVWWSRGLREPLLRFGEVLREFVQGGGRDRRVGGKAVRERGRGTVSE